jgi:hypothetical protein
MDSKDSSEKSLFFESLIEHCFISEIMMYGYYSFNKEINVLHSDIDNSGYDVVFDFEHNGQRKSRFIQLKQSQMDSSTRKQNLNLDLLNYPNPCIVWIKHEYNINHCELNFEYYFWGNEIDKPVPDISAYKVAKTTKADANGVKKERENIREIPLSAFKRCGLGELFCILTGTEKGL